MTVHIYEGTHSWTEAYPWQAPDGTVHQQPEHFEANIAYCGKDDACPGGLEFTDGDRDATCEECLEAYALHMLSRDLG